MNGLEIKNIGNKVSFVNCHVTERISGREYVIKNEKPEYVSLANGMFAVPVAQDPDRLRGAVKFLLEAYNSDGLEPLPRWISDIVA